MSAVMSAVTDNTTYAIATVRDGDRTFFQLAGADLDAVLADVRWVFRTDYDGATLRQQSAGSRYHYNAYRAGTKLAVTVHLHIGRFDGTTDTYDPHMLTPGTPHVVLWDRIHRCVATGIALPGTAGMDTDDAAILAARLMARYTLAGRGGEIGDRLAWLDPAKLTERQQRNPEAGFMWDTVRDEVAHALTATGAPVHFVSRWWELAALYPRTPDTEPLAATTDVADVPELGDGETPFTVDSAPSSLTVWNLSVTTAYTSEGWPAFLSELVRAIGQREIGDLYETEITGAHVRAIADIVARPETAPAYPAASKATASRMLHAFADAMDETAAREESAADNARRCTWTVAYRDAADAPTLARVTDFAGTWEESVRLASSVGVARPDSQVFYVPTRASELAGYVPTEDIGNVLADPETGARVPMVDTATLADVLGGSRMVAACDVRVGDTVIADGHPRKVRHVMTSGSKARTTSIATWSGDPIVCTASALIEVRAEESPFTVSETGESLHRGRTYVTRDAETTHEATLDAAQAASEAAWEAHAAGEDEDEADSARRGIGHFALGAPRPAFRAQDEDEDEDDADADAAPVSYPLPFFPRTVGLKAAYRPNRAQRRAAQRANRRKGNAR